MTEQATGPAPGTMTIDPAVALQEALARHAALEAFYRDRTLGLAQTLADTRGERDALAAQLEKAAAALEDLRREVDAMHGGSDA